MEGEVWSNMKSSSANFPTWWEREWSLVQKSRFLVQSTERIVISTNGNPGATSSLRRKRMSFNLTDLICSTFEKSTYKYLEGWWLKRNCGWHTLYYRSWTGGWQSPLTIHFNVSKVRKAMLNVEKLLKINLSTCHTFKKNQHSVLTTQQLSQCLAYSSVWQTLSSAYYLPGNRNTNMN